MKVYNVNNEQMYKIEDVRTKLRCKGGTKEVEKFDKFIKDKPGIDNGKSFYIFKKDYQEYNGR